MYKDINIGTTCIYKYIPNSSGILRGGDMGVRISQSKTFWHKPILVYKLYQFLKLTIS